MTEEEIEKAIEDEQKNPISEITINLATLEQLLITKKVISEDEFKETYKLVEQHYKNEIKQQLKELEDD